MATIGFLMALLVNCLLIATSALTTRVRVREGIIIGKTVHFEEFRQINVSKNVDVFLGVPYADPPVRFTPPTPKTPWQGELNVTQFKPACMQPVYHNFPVVDEDCLYLNIYAPNPRPKKAAVLVWIHGGTFVTGSAMTYMFYGVPLVVVGDVIVVSINYRVGIFSRFSTRDNESPGNYGMLDQVAALRWVRDNIEAFGGDRNRVTIFGNSAGSASVDFLTLSKLSHGLFSQAIMQSGNSFSQWAFRDTSVEMDRSTAKRLGYSMGCPIHNSSAMVACLRTKEARNLLRKAGGIYGWYKIFVDGTFLEDTPTNLYRRGDFMRCPIMAGFNKDEGSLTPYFQYRRYMRSSTHPPISQRAFQNHVTNLILREGYSGAVLRNAVLEKYMDWTRTGDPMADFFDSFVKFETDMYYSCTTDRVLRAHAMVGDKLFKYLFTHEPTKSIIQYKSIIPSTRWLKSGHGEDLTFVFGMPFINQLYHIRGHNMTEEEKFLSVKMMRFWTNFAKSGDPSKSTADSPPGHGPDLWPEFTVPALQHKELSPELAVGRAARAEHCHFLNVYLPRLKASTSNVASLTEVERQWREDYSSWKLDIADWRRDYVKYKAGLTMNEN